MKDKIREFSLENTGKHFHDSGVSAHFLKRTSKKQTLEDNQLTNGTILTLRTYIH